MKNQKLKHLALARMASAVANAEQALILNKEDLLFVEGGVGPVNCPSLQSCGTFSNCNGKCGVNDIKIDVPILKF